MPINIERLLRPQSIAVFGGREAAEVVRQCERLGFSGPLYPVHPHKTSVAGRPCYRSVAELPQAPDAAYVAVNRELSVGIVAQLAQRNAGGAVCYASGFKESNSDDRQQALVNAAKEMPLLGPNCYGLINYLDRVALWPDQHGGRPVERGVALITQSGNMALNLTMQRRALPIAYVVTLGNQAQIGLAAVIEAMLDDARVSAIGLHFESIDNVQAFARAAQRAGARGIPLVAVKTGRSAAGARLALSHTAALTSRDDLLGAFLARLGIARVHSLAVLLETLKLLHVCGPLPGNRLGSMSCSGGEAALLADRIEDYALCFPALTQARHDSVKATLGGLATVSNPLDYHTFSWGDAERLQAVYSAMLASAFDLTLLVLDFPRPDRCSLNDWQAAVDAIIAAHKSQRVKTAVLATLAENLPESIGEMFLACGIAPLQGLDEGLAAIEAAAWLGTEGVNGVLSRQNEVNGILSRQNTENTKNTAQRPVSFIDTVLIDEWEAKQCLSRYGIPCPAGKKVRAQEAVAAAEALGYPLVVKACGAQFVHKTEQNAVALNLQNADQLAQAVRRLGALSSELIVESMIGDGVGELIIGINRDTQFGLYLIIGPGGVLAELFQDSRILLLPCSTRDIRQAITRLRIYPLLAGYRKQPAGDIDQAIAAIEALGAFAMAHKNTLLELEINPLIVRPSGRGVVAADALIRYLP